MSMFDDLQKLKDREETERQAAQQALPATRPMLPKPPPAKPATKQLTTSRGPQPRTVPVADATTEVPPMESNSEPAPQFDITEIAFRPDTFIFTEEEFNALWDLKQELRRTYDLRLATKQNIIRCALHCLVEDFRRNKERSFVVQRLRNKQ